ncbi:metalloregulator ArsR/SmtB family transcription factor (plasmid) [Arthrobacter agilis]|nr:metalloregulator ArsR/SmtB family transcription factor [Arthrobacter agilis]WDF35153.1 metalloregulator ArsR/SmtB family transcription factor [Arthrobacter agilis]
MTGMSEVSEVCAGDGLEPAVALFRSLGDPTRLAILRTLASGEARVGTLVGELGLAQSTVSAHIACLKDCGLVVGRTEGRKVLYSLAQPELMDMLAQAEVLLAVTGNAVDLCSTYGSAQSADTSRTTQDSVA